VTLEFNTIQNVKTSTRRQMSCNDGERAAGVVTVIGLLVLISIGSWQIHVLTPQYNSCQGTAFRAQITGQFIGNSTVQYITPFRFERCTLQPGEDSGLIVNQLCVVYTNQNPIQQCSLTSTNCDSIEGKIAGWGVGLGLSIAIVLVLCFGLC